MNEGAGNNGFSGISADKEIIRCGNPCARKGKREGEVSFCEIAVRERVPCK